MPAAAAPGCGEGANGRGDTGEREGHPEPFCPTWVKLGLVGYVNTDNVETLGKDEFDGYVGALCTDSMFKVNAALSVARALP